MGPPNLSTAATLDLWQAAERRDPVERSLLLAAASGGAPADDELARLPLGRLDARLLALHRELGGGDLEATALCPTCEHRLEFSLDPGELLDRAADPASPTPVESGGYIVAWRLPDSRDAAAAAATGDAAAAERALLARCVSEASGPDGGVDSSALPAEVRGALARSMADADPLAEVRVEVGCSNCGSDYMVDLDLGEFVWAELRARARRLLREVDALERSYGCTEAEVLALDNGRRAAYLDLLREGAR